MQTYSRIDSGTESALKESVSTPQKVVCLPLAFIEQDRFTIRIFNSAFRLITISARALSPTLATDVLVVVRARIAASTAFSVGYANNCMTALQQIDTAY